MVLLSADWSADNAAVKALKLLWELELVASLPVPELGVIIIAFTIRLPAAAFACEIIYSI